MSRPVFAILAFLVLVAVVALLVGVIQTAPEF